MWACDSLPTVTPNCLRRPRPAFHLHTWPGAVLLPGPFTPSLLPLPCFLKPVKIRLIFYSPSQMSFENHSPSPDGSRACSWKSERPGFESQFYCFQVLKQVISLLCAVVSSRYCMYSAYLSDCRRIDDQRVIISSLPWLAFLCETHFVLNER